MSAVQDELDRRTRVYYQQRVDSLVLQLQHERTEHQAALTAADARYAFESREIHPFERNCPMGLHRLGLPYYGIPLGWDDTRRRPKTLLVCQACYLQRHEPDREAIDATP